MMTAVELDLTLTKKEDDVIEISGNFVTGHFNAKARYQNIYIYQFDSII